MTATIANLLQIAQTEEQEAQRQKAETERAQADYFRDQTKEVIGKQLPELLTYLGQFNYQTDNKGHVTSIWAKALYPDMNAFMVYGCEETYRTIDEEKSKFKVTLRRITGRSGSGKTMFESHGPAITDRAAVAKFLLERRREHESELERERQKEIDQQLWRFGDDYHRARSPEQANEAYQALCQIDPTQQPRWKELLDQWQAGYEAREAAEREASEKVRQRHLAVAKMEAAYEAAYTTYWLARQEIVKWNLAALDKLQAELNEAYMLYDFWYGVVGSEDGERYATEERCTVLADDTGHIYPDQPMKCVSSGGRVTEKLFYKQNHVGQSSPRLVHPTDQDHAAHHTIYPGDGYGISKTLYYSPHRPQSEVVDMVKSVLRQIPAWDDDGEALASVRLSAHAEGSAWASLGSGLMRDIERKVQQAHPIQTEPKQEELF